MLLLFMISLIVPVIYGIQTPIIGVLTEETDSYPGHVAYIAASYIKFVESSGGRAIPVWIGQNDSYYERVVNYTNGILLPGGATSFTNNEGYAGAARKLYALAKQMNDDGVHYPILGICLGMEVMSFAELDGFDIRQNCKADYVALNLRLLPDASESKFFGEAGSQIKEYLTTENTTFNNHDFCFTVETASKYMPEYYLTSVSYDEYGTEFIATMEHKSYPFYATQYHPEKVLFEFLVPNIPRTLHATMASQYVTDFFMSECKKNDHTFPTKEKEQDALIYNYQTLYTGKQQGADFVETYAFTAKDFVTNQLL